MAAKTLIERLATKNREITAMVDEGREAWLGLADKLSHGEPFTDDERAAVTQLGDMLGITNPEAAIASDGDAIKRRRYLEETLVSPEYESTTLNAERDRLKIEEDRLKRELFKVTTAINVNKLSRQNRSGFMAEAEQIRVANRRAFGEWQVQK